MQFALAVPWWALLLIALVAAGLAWTLYGGSAATLPQRPRFALIGLRAAVLLLIVLCLLRPVRVVPPDDPPDAVVAVLVDGSRSMQLADAGGAPRIEAARAVTRQLEADLAGAFRTEIWTFGSALERSDAETMAAQSSATDLSGALAGVRDRYRDRPLAAVVVVSDGGDTGATDAAGEVADGAVPVFTVGVGAPDIGIDLEVVDVAAGEATLEGSAVDLTVSASSRGTAEPFDLRLLENGRPIDLRRVVPAGDGSPVREVFTVAPSLETPTVYTVEIPQRTGERVSENNARSVLVEAPGRRRRVLVVEGAPGFEHSFFKRAVSADPGLEIDAVVRKGQDGDGNPTYLVQSTPDRARSLTTGFPATREALYQYDAVVLANAGADVLSDAQLAMAADFVGARGGGLLVLGARSFEPRGLAGTPLETALPLAFTGRGAGVLRTSASVTTPFHVSVTADGERHPVTRIGATPDETARRWNALPPLAGAAALGAPRAGAQVLAVVRAADGARPLLAVQRYGQGRTMLFTGEASWRWRMQLPAADATYERLWRHALRWLASSARAALDVPPLAVGIPGATEEIVADVRDGAFAPVSDAEVTMTVTEPGGEPRGVGVAPVDAAAGRYAARFRFAQPGIHRIAVEARRGGTALGTSERWVLVGGADREMTDPRLNEDVLRRVAQASGGDYVAAEAADRLPSLLAVLESDSAPPQIEDLWHNGWMFTLIVALLSAEWLLRRRVGLR